MKKALTIILTLIFGVGVNVLAGSGALGLVFLAWGYFDGAEYVAIAVAAVLFAALLSFLAVKLKKIVNGAAFILCAQLPAVIMWAVFYSSADAPSFDIVGLITSVAAMAVSLILWAIFSNKDRFKKWWNEPP